MATRRARLAGSWYPADASSTRREVEALIGPSSEVTGLGGIVPHAGWVFSGAAAAGVFQAVAAAEPPPQILLLFGGHLGPRSLAHVSRASAFETPLGPIAAAEELAARLADELGLGPDPADSGEADNTVEVQLPLIKHLLPDVALVVLGLPASTEAVRVGETAARLAGAEGRPVAAVGSTDLTHYGPNYGFSPRGHGEDAVRWVKQDNDARLIERLLAMDPEGVVEVGTSRRAACCPGAAAAALAAARALGARRAELLDYHTSYDVRPGSSFVGYAGVVLTR